jgi:hypothetical protein
VANLNTPDQIVIMCARQSIVAVQAAFEAAGAQLLSPQGNRMKENGSSFRQGMPESSARDGSVPVAQVRDLGNASGHRLPSLDDGFRHPCRNDGAFCLSDDLYCFMRLP